MLKATRSKKHAGEAGDPYLSVETHPRRQWQLPKKTLQDHIQKQYQIEYQIDVDGGVGGGGG